MNKAKMLLEETDIPVNEIAFELGFESHSNFYRAFKKKIDDTPENFRKRSQKPSRSTDLKSRQIK